MPVIEITSPCAEMNGFQNKQISRVFDNSVVGATANLLILVRY